MSARPARDALRHAFVDYCANDDALHHGAIDTCLGGVMDEPDLVLAALIESGWQPTDDHLRAMGGTPTTMVRTVVGTLPLREPALWNFPKERNDG